MYVCVCVCVSLILYNYFYYVIIIANISFLLLIYHVKDISIRPWGLDIWILVL